MKPFIEVVLVAVAILLFAFGYIPASIFVGMFAAILFLAPERKGSKTPDEIMAEARGEAGSNIVNVKYEFKAEKGEVFSAALHIYSTKDLTEAKVLEVLAEYVTDHTGMKTEPERLHLLSYSAA
ncbi:hypothetical protein DQT32_03745 [Salmonella enterica subsp. enterica serovar Braenderup]|nr:hypothetical protein [Salmonella enterica subsp. enterica serovar Braenderup]